MTSNSALTNAALLESQAQRRKNFVGPRQPGYFNLLGPFKWLLQLSGLNLKWENQSKCRRFVSYVLGALIIILMFWRTRKELMNCNKKICQTNLLEELWEGLILSVVLYGSWATVVMIWWTSDGVIKNFEKGLAKIATKRINVTIPSDNRRRLFRNLGFISIVIIATWVLTSMDGFLYTKLNENYTNESFIPYQYEFNHSNMYGLELLANFYAAVSTALSLIVCVTMIRSNNDELTNFNEELKSKSEDGTILQELNSFSSRHSELLSFIKTSNREIQKFVAAGLVFIIFAGIFSLAIQIIFYESISKLFSFTVCMWAYMSFYIIYFIASSADKTPHLIHGTVEILVHDPHLAATSDQSIQQTYRVMLDRCRETHTNIRVLGFFPLSGHSFMKILAIPTIATYLAAIFYKKISM